MHFVRAWIRQCVKNQNYKASTEVQALFIVLF